MVRINRQHRSHENSTSVWIGWDINSANIISHNDASPPTAGDSGLNSSTPSPSRLFLITPVVSPVWGRRVLVSLDLLFGVGGCAELNDVPVE